MACKRVSSTHTFVQKKPTPSQVNGEFTGKAIRATFPSLKQGWDGWSYFFYRNATLHHVENLEEKAQFIIFVSWAVTGNPIQAAAKFFVTRGGGGGAMKRASWVGGGRVWGHATSENFEI